MLENVPSESIMTELIGRSLYEVWQKLCLTIDEKYEMEQLWNTGGRKWTYEYKYRRGGKTLCCLLKESLIARDKPEYTLVFLNRDMPKALRFGRFLNIKKNIG